jgi:hypothetical protein
MPNSIVLDLGQSILNPLTAEVALRPLPPAGHDGAEHDLRPVQQLGPGRSASNMHSNKQRVVTSGDSGLVSHQWTSKAINHGLETHETVIESWESRTAGMASLSNILTKTFSRHRRSTRLTRARRPNCPYYSCGDLLEGADVIHFIRS